MASEMSDLSNQRNAVVHAVWNAAGETIKGRRVRARGVVTEKYVVTDEPILSDLHSRIINLCERMVTFINDIVDEGGAARLIANVKAYDPIPIPSRSQKAQAQDQARAQKQVRRAADRARGKARQK
jgi:hypothetical protein